MSRTDFDQSFIHLGRRRQPPFLNRGNPLPGAPHRVRRRSLGRYPRYGQIETRAFSFPFNAFCGKRPSSRALPLIQKIIRPCNRHALRRQKRPAAVENMPLSQYPRPVLCRLRTRKRRRMFLRAHRFLHAEEHTVIGALHRKHISGGLGNRTVEQIPPQRFVQIREPLHIVQQRRGTRR